MDITNWGLHALGQSTEISSIVRVLAVMGKVDENEMVGVDPVVVKFKVIESSRKEE